MWSPTLAIILQYPGLIYLESLLKLGRRLIITFFRYTNTYLGCGEGSVAFEERNKMAAQDSLDYVHHVGKYVLDEIEEMQNCQRTPAIDACCVPRIMVTLGSSLTRVLVTLLPDAIGLFVVPCTGWGSSTCASTR